MNIVKALSSNANFEIDRTYTVYYSMGGLTTSVVIRAKDVASAKVGIEELMGCVVTHVKEK